MASWEDVRAVAMSLPSTVEDQSRGQSHWKVGDRLFVWERPLRTGDIAALGDTAPDGPILGVRVADEGVKHALIADNPDVFFTIPHFDGYPAVLVRLERADPAELAEVVTEAWLLRAPKRVARQYLAQTGRA
jgi:hypothetical protein